MYPVLVEIGPLTIYSLGILWALGALAGAWIVSLELKRYGYDPDLAGSIVIAAANSRRMYAVYCGILARESHCRTRFDGVPVDESGFNNDRLDFFSAAQFCACALAYGMIVILAN